MRIFKSKWFNKWAEKEALTDEALTEAIAKMEDGLNDGDLGGHVYTRVTSKCRIQLELETFLGKALIEDNGYSLVEINNAA